MFQGRLKEELLLLSIGLVLEGWQEHTTVQRELSVQQNKHILERLSNGK
jgi:hypothetical protein